MNQALPDWKLLGYILRDARIARGDSLRGLADQLSVHYTTLSKNERGITRPSAPVLGGYVTRYGLDAAWLEKLAASRPPQKFRTAMQRTTCTVEHEVSLMFANDGRLARVENRWKVIAFVDDVESLALMVVPEALISDRFHALGGGLETFSSPSSTQENRSVGLRLRFPQPLQHGGIHEVTVAYNPSPDLRMWLMSPEPLIWHRQLRLRVWMPAGRTNHIELYGVNWYPMGLRLPPPFYDTDRRRPNGNGFAEWKLEDLEARKYCGVVWRTR